MNNLIALSTEIWGLFILQHMKSSFGRLHVLTDDNGRCSERNWPVRRLPGPLIFKDDWNTTGHMTGLRTVLFAELLSLWEITIWDSFIYSFTQQIFINHLLLTLNGVGTEHTAVNRLLPHETHIWVAGEDTLMSHLGKEWAPQAHVWTWVMAGLLLCQVQVWMSWTVQKRKSCEEPQIKWGTRALSVTNSLHALDK